MPPTSFKRGPNGQKCGVCVVSLVSNPPGNYPVQATSPPDIIPCISAKNSCGNARAVHICCNHHQKLLAGDIYDIANIPSFRSKIDQRTDYIWDNLVKIWDAAPRTDQTWLIWWEESGRDGGVRFNCPRWIASIRADCILA